MTRQEGGRLGAFSWNAAGWFGSQLGATLWMGLLGALTLPMDPLAGGFALLACAAVNAAGLWMWRRHERLEPYPAIQTLGALSGVAALATLLVMDASGRLGETEHGPGPAGMYLILLVYPAIMLQFWWLERCGRRQ